MSEKKALYFFRDAVRRAQLILILVLIFGILYIGFGVIGSSTFRNPYEVTLQVPSSAGLFKGSMVSYRGQQVGKVLKLNLTKTGIDVVLQINRSVKVPKDVKAEVHNLSPVGEQYVDLQPQSDGEPYLADGDKISPDNAQLPLQISGLLDHLDNLTAGISSKDLTTVVEQTAVGLGGTADELSAILDNSAKLVGTLQRLQPETISLINNGGTVLRTMEDYGDEFVRFSSSLRQVTAQLKASDPKLRDLMDRSLAALKQLDALFRENESAAAAMFRNLVVMTDVLADRVPALEYGYMWMPEAGNALQAVAIGGQLRGKILIGTAKTCDYKVHRNSPVTDDQTTDYLYRYCSIRNDPDRVVRGAANAPRPRGDDTAYPPR